MKKAVLLVLPFCLLVVMAYAGDTVIEEIIARVNNSIITRGELERARTQTLQDLKQQVGEAQANTEWPNKEKDVLRDLIDQQLLLQKAKDLGLNADADVVRRLDEIRKNMKLDSLEALEKAAEAQGVSYEDFKQNIANDILYRQVVQREVGGHINITTEEEKQFYEKHKEEMNRPEAVRLSEILISTEPKTVKDASGNEQRVDRTPEEIAAAEAKAKDIVEQLKKGAKFDELATKNSEGPTAQQGGDLGYFERGKLAKELEDITFNMKPGTYSDVIRTKQGYVVLEVTEHTTAGIPPFKDVEQQIQNAVYGEKMQPALRAYLTKLREEAFIDIKQGYVDTGASPNETKPVIADASQAPEKGKPQQEKKKKRFLLF